MTKSCPFWQNSYICERQTYSNFEILLYWRLYRYSKKSYQTCPLRHEKEYIIRLKQSFGPVASSAIAIYQGSWSRARCTGIRNFIFYFNADSACYVIFSFETKSKRIQLGLFLIHIIDLNFFLQSNQCTQYEFQCSTILLIFRPNNLIFCKRFGCCNDV